MVGTRNGMSGVLRASPWAVVCVLLALLAGGGMGVAAGAEEAETATEASLFERLGGLPAVALVVSDFMTAFVQDPVIMANPAVRERKTGDAVPVITYQVTTMVCEATGGPCRYAGPSLRDAHEGLNVSPREWDRMGEIFVETLQRHGVPEQEQQELLAILGPTREEIVVAAGDP